MCLLQKGDPAVSGGLGDRGQLGLVLVSQGAPKVSDVPDEEGGEKGGASDGEGSPEIVQDELPAKVAPAGATRQRAVMQQGPEGPRAADRRKVGL